MAMQKFTMDVGDGRKILVDLDVIKGMNDCHILSPPMIYFLKSQGITTLGKLWESVFLPNSAPAWKIGLPNHLAREWEEYHCSHYKDGIHPYLCYDRLVWGGHVESGCITFNEVNEHITFISTPLPFAETTATW